MTPITLKAHFDGKQILLDEPFDLKAGTPLTITVMTADSESENFAWTSAAATGLARAYGDNEPEYTLQDIKR